MAREGLDSGGGDTRVQRVYSSNMRALISCFLVIAVAGIALAPIACATSITGESGLGGGGESSTTTGAGGGEEDAGTDAAGPCLSAADCASFGDACNEGACINGVCGKLPTNDLGACDDGINCTENDTCQGGVCVGGTTKFCPSSSTCLVGSCDVMTDTCVEVPGNDGASCVDDDACTLAGTCVGGFCQAGGQVDCSFLDGVCSKGYCDPAIGCKVMPVNDGTPCDDNLYCTVNDTCQSGMCSGVPNTCAPPGDVCKIGTCNEAMKTCVAVPGNDGAACDDGNPCTAGETCGAGNCVGGQPANNGMACDDADGCTMGTTCANGLCTNPTSAIAQCIDGDSCCPAGCQGNDDDCMVCHYIGYDQCPTQATEFCVPPPLDPFSAVHAKIACDTCYGISCFLETADCAGPGYGPMPPGQYISGDAYFGYETGCSGDEGRVWAISSSFTTYGYWGK